MRHWKIILSLVAIFIVGFVSGGVTTLAITKRAMARRAAINNLGPAVAQHYARQLDLTPEQVEKLKPIFARAAADIRSSRSNMMMQVMLTMREMNEEVARELTPEQRAEFEKMKERNRSRLKGQFNATLPPPMRRPQKPQ